MRSKEDAHDYRYFPDPDLPPLVIAPDWIEAVRATLPELPAAMALRFQQQDGLAVDDAAVMTQSLAFARFYEAARDGCGAPKLVANWLMGEFSRRLNTEGKAIAQSPVGAGTLAALIRRISDATLSHNAARQVLDALWSAADPQADPQADASRIDGLIDAMGLRQISDTGALAAIVDEVVAANPKSVEEFRAGKDKAFNALVGQVMKASRGKANPAQVNDLLRQRLG
jgi:aspartyl-tRNA(Asn)/glutamyl-tRNA(Gln) amidotransferase subunit B